MNELNYVTFVDLVERYLLLGEEIPLDKIKPSYDELCKELETFCTNTQPSYEMLRSLKHMKAEFELLKYHRREFKLNDQATKYSTFYFVLSLVYKMEKFIAIECEIVLMQLQVLPLAENRSDMSWKGSINDLLELCSALFALKVIYRNGVPASFADIVSGLENLFNIKIDSKGKKRLRLFDRLNMTSFLDKLKSAFMLDADSRL